MNRGTIIVGTVAVLVSGMLQAVPVAAGEKPGIPGKKKIVFVAGRPSHGYGSHEHNAGCLLLAKCLEEGMPTVRTVVCRNGWPADSKVFDDAAAIVIFCDGGGGHVALRHLGDIDRFAKKGVGLAFLHYAVEISKGRPGNCFLNAIGGYYEQGWSINPHWTARFAKLPDHPIARGVRPFSIRDEWYYHMRFRKDMAGVTPILAAVPPDSTRKRPDGGHSGNKHVRARMGMPEHVGWAYQRPDGGRGFGFTGGHFQWNWGHDDFRKVVLNAIVWVSGLDVPTGGVASKTPTVEQLEANQDYPRPKGHDRRKIREQIQRWNATAPSAR